MNSILVASDLDRTLIYSARAFFLDVPDHLAPDMVVAELHEGVPISFMTRTAERLLLELTRTTIFVPVTTRTEAQYRRVRLPGAVPEYAVTTNGGVLLKNGEPDIEWQTTVGQRVSEGSAPLAVIEEFLSRGPTGPGFSGCARPKSSSSTPSWTGSSCPRNSCGSWTHGVPRSAGRCPSRAASSTVCRTR
ncbi:conserved hypothetical protein [Arthrobacter sp. Hiyo4]|nr:conserved hypothetical protein [Arthrobacter sp. Hiyo4]